MPTIYADSGDGMIYSPTTDWEGARDATSGTVNSTNATEQEAITVFKFSGRGATTYRVYRSFFYFDTSAITTTVSSATLKLRFLTTRAGSANAIAIASTAFGGNGGTSLADGDFNALDFGTPYTSEIDTSNTSTYTSITLNATALSAMQNNDYLIFALINHAYDYNNEPPEDANTKVKVTFANQTGTSTDPAIEYTAAAVTPPYVFFNKGKYKITSGKIKI
tara:strand:+ start:2109 stop:2771 length:663 start_codon:yes stop_codon:yes gene_type:complete